MKKRASIVVCLLCTVFLVTGLSACNGGKSANNAEFEEFKEIVTVVDETLTGMPHGVQIFYI